MLLQREGSHERGFSRHNGEKNPVLHPDGSVSWDSFNKAGECGFKAGKHELLPFPANELYVNENIKQNPGW